jgi:membrane-associated protease RseP (regulator of RpoE activity)
MRIARRLVPIIRRTTPRFYKVMTPYAVSSNAPVSVKETVDIMASNLDKALAATSHDFRSDTVTGPFPQATLSHNSADARNVAEYVYHRNVYRRHLQSRSYDRPTGNGGRKPHWA